MKYTSIVISGPIAAGTSTAAKALAQKLNLQYRSAGDFFRQYMLDHNIPLYDKSQIPDELDKKIDEELTALAQKGGVVVDADYIGYFVKNMPQVLKILLTCNYQIRIKRALLRTHTHKETEAEIKMRQEGLYQKFHKLYSSEDYLNPKFFNLVIDTGNTSKEEVVNRIAEKFLSANS